MILHIDMDAFFASVEQRDHPELIGKPVVVGGTSPRSVVAAASYEARRFGIRSAMPMYQAREKCAQLIVMHPDKTKYKNISKTIMSMLYDYSPLVEPVSIDEAYLDVSGCERISGTPHEIAGKIKKRIKNELSLTCSIGIAPLKFLAKIASDMKKPDGITIIAAGDTHAFVKALDIHKIPGVGEKTMETMKLLGIKKLGDVGRFNLQILEHKFGKFGIRLSQLAQCIDDSTVDIKEKSKSISSETTLPHDIHSLDEIKKELLIHSHTVAGELRRKGLFASVIFIKFKFSDFSQITRQIKIIPPACASSIIYRKAAQLGEALKEEMKVTRKIRLIGVGASCLSDRRIPEQMDLFQDVDGNSEKWEVVDRTIDALTQKFGKNIVSKATLS